MARKKEEKLRIEYVDLDTVKKWERNPKVHDIGGLITSMQKYGFRDAPIYDATLDCIVGGNGRIDALLIMRDNELDAPRGILYDLEDEKWFVPIQFGIDADSKEAAEAFAIDHNNLTMLGGDFTIYEISRMWDKEYSDILKDLAEQDSLPISVDGDDLDYLLQDFDFESSTSDRDLGETDHEIAKVTVTIGNVEKSIEAIQLIKELVDEHPNWKAKITT